MKKILTASLAVLIACATLTGCTEEIMKAKQETTEAVDNLKAEAINIGEGVQEKIDQVNQAKDSLEEAADAVNQAKEDLKAITK